ncbi:hypothetical protein EDD90_5726 [Streptomyces sp. Ag109_O5-1]|nr:hypothetical protein EDD90_5726 [Streptomyces sp. Ag109_O5-1]
MQLDEQRPQATGRVVLILRHDARVAGPNDKTEAFGKASDVHGLGAFVLAARLSFRLIHPRPGPSTAVHATDRSTGMNEAERPWITP